jgi:predicted Zn-dependent protease with MMP-like domain
MTSIWKGAAPNLEDFEVMARVAFAKLPTPFRDLCRDIVFRVQDFPEDSILTEMQCETEYDLLGLFTGASLGERQGGALHGMLPNMIFLFRRPILDCWAETGEGLEALVTHVLVHEIGHHFGLSDADMERIEASVAD